MADELRLKTIVLGYDGTRSAERALERAAAIAKAFGAKIVVTDVAAPQPVQAAPGAFGLVPYYEYTSDIGLRADAVRWREHRDRIDSLLDGRGIEHEFAGVVGQPAAEIVDVAESRDADLIVVGTRQAGFLERLFGGSVSQGVARRAHCDVLVVHPAGEDDPDG
ncbi:MAG TPA: universal stress protein [Gaiellaceae bacterium]|jgi:nucleotide-binding universal stress UspA family protein|nr:universal stress protein [Gaiellaceae bacterium]